MALVGLTREPSAAFGLALPGFVVSASAVSRGLTQQRTAHRRHAAKDTNHLDLHAVKARAAGRYWGKGGWNVSGWVALLAGVGAALLTVTPILTGPVARLLDGSGPVFISAAAYVLLAGRRVRCDS